MIHCKFLPTPLRFLILTVLLLGIFLRFTNLGDKVYWHDETFTSLRISGYTSTELLAEINNKGIVSSQELQKYQYPNQEKNAFDTIRSLAVEDPQHPPLYFVLARFWVQLFGNSVAVIRSFSAVISLLALPSVYWLCQELFLDSTVGWIAVALFAISPFHLLFAQEAREYTLWLVMILLASAALLRSLRVKTKLSWAIYAIALALGFYSFLFTGLVAVAHGIYILAIEGFRFTKTVKAYLIASLSGCLMFIPWLIIVVNNLTYINEATDWTAKSSGLFFLSKIWILNITHLFLDVEFSFKNPLFYLIVPILGIVIYSLYFLYSQTSMRVWLFIFTLMGATALPLLLPDLIFGGWRSGVPRYLIPCYLGIQIAVAYLITAKLAAIDLKIWFQKLWQIIGVTLIICGVISCVTISQASTWWNKYNNQEDWAIAHIINQANQPLLISDEPLGNVLSLSYLLEPKVQLLLYMKSSLPEINQDFSDVFVYSSSPSLRSSLESKTNSELESLTQIKHHRLWKLLR